MITNKQIQDLTDVVIKHTNAKMVYLFGSYALNEANKNSDVDLLVIVNENLNKEKRRKVISQLGLKTFAEGFLFPKDFKVYSLKEYEELKSDKTSFLYNILQNAQPLYVG